LSIGKHQLVLKAWDLLGNLTKDTLWFIVPNKDNVKAKDLVNKPNPMLNYTQFSFDLNSQDPNIETEFSLRNLNGQLLVNKILPHKNMSNKWVMDWDGRDQSGAVIAPGLYLYTITVRAGSQIFVLSNKLMKL
jgi:flagellar hook assembly protein FlgD